MNPSFTGLSDRRQARSLGTHDGLFHADEVTACSLLWLFGRIDLEKVIRTRRENLLALCEYVCDVGGCYDCKNKRFDHHQKEYAGEKSSAGLVLSYLYEEKEITFHEWSFLNDSMIAGIDAHDNGRSNLERGVASFSQIISNFTPIAHNATVQELDAAFFAAVHFSKEHLERLLFRYRYNLSCREKVSAVMARSQDVLLFEEPLPWLDNFFALGGVDHPARFVIMPSGGHWKLRGIPPNLNERMHVRLPLPQEWAGLMEEMLVEKSGIPGAVFCHKGRFISVWKRKEDALEALKIVQRRLL